MRGNSFLIFEELGFVQYPDCRAKLRRYTEGLIGKYKGIQNTDKKPFKTSCQVGSMTVDGELTSTIKDNYLCMPLI